MKRAFSIILFLIILFYPLIYGQNFDFALLTDLHISKNSTALIDLENSVNHINQNSSIAFVLVTGDITENGDSESLMQAKKVLDNLKVDYYIVSGNHETKWSESGATDFARIFGSERFRFEYQGILFLGFSTGPVMRMADGHVAPQDISWLKETLNEVGKEKLVLLVTHYPLMNGDVDNWYEVTDIVRKYNVKAFLGGHYHTNKFFMYDGIPGFINRSNLRAGNEVGGYSVYKVRPDSIMVYEYIIGDSLKKWGGISMTATYYGEDNTIYPRPDFSINDKYPEIKPDWLIEIGNGIYSSPAIYNNRIYVGDDLGYLTCLNLQDGNKVWDFKVAERIVGTPGVAENIVVFGSADCGIYGIDAVSGHLLWRVSANAPVLGAVTIENKVAYIGSSDHIFRAIDIKTGAIVWQYEGIEGYVETLPLIYDNKVIFGAWDNSLYALNKANGRLAWKWDGGLNRMHFSPAAVWPVGANGKVFITDPERAMTAINVADGQTVWRTKDSMVRETIGLSADHTKIYSKTMQDSLVCYSTQTSVAEKIWSVNVGYGYDHAPSMPVEKEGVVFGSTKNGLIFAVSTEGNLLWKYKVGNSLINTVVPLNSHKCVFTSSEGIIGILSFNN